MNSIAVLTAVYDQYDDLKPALPQTGADVDWVFVTDDPALQGEKELRGWRVVYEPRPGVHPNRAAKRPKFLPWEYTNAPASVWVDASFRIVSEAFAVDALKHADPIAQFTHPWRDCLYDETAECIAIARHKYPPGLLARQAASYRQAGHPEHWGLWATGVIARQHDDARVKQLGQRWLEEVEQWSFQDQVSHPYVVREAGLRPTPFPGTHLANPWLAYEGSGRH